MQGVNHGSTCTTHHHDKIKMKEIALKARDCTEADSRAVRIVLDVFLEC